MNKIEMQEMKIRSSRGDRVFYAVCGAVVAILTLLVLYPIIYVVSASFSSPAALVAGKVFLWPVDVGLEGYQAVFNYDKVWIGYRNTIFYVVLGTSINIAVTLSCAYPLSRKTLPGRGIFMGLFTFTMLFGAGMIPDYILMKNLKLINTIWAMVLPGAMSVYNMIVARTFLQNSIPEDLLDAARIDGCDDFRYFFSIILPLSKAIIAVLALWYAVGHWNAYFNAFLYLKDQKLYPLQIFLKDVLVSNQFSSEDMMDPETIVAMQNRKLLLKYSLIVVSTAPLFFFYPFVQKYFVKGIMIGSVKG